MGTNTIHKHDPRNEETKWTTNHIFDNSNARPGEIVFCPSRCRKSASSLRCVGGEFLKLGLVRQFDLPRLLGHHPFAVLPALFTADQLASCSLLTVENDIRLVISFGSECLVDVGNAPRTELFGRQCF